MGESCDARPLTEVHPSVVSVDGQIMSYSEGGTGYSLVEYDTGSGRVSVRAREGAEPVVMSPGEALKRGLMHPNLGPVETRPKAVSGTFEDVLPVLNLESEAGGPGSLTPEERDALARGREAAAADLDRVLREIDGTDPVKLAGGTAVEDEPDVNF